MVSKPVSCFVKYRQYCLVRLYHLLFIPHKALHPKKKENSLFSKPHKLGLLRIQVSDFRWEQPAKKMCQRHKLFARFGLDIRKNFFPWKIIQPWDGILGFTFALYQDFQLIVPNLAAN